MFHKIKIVFITFLAAVFFITSLVNCKGSKSAKDSDPAKDSNSALEQRIKNMEQKVEDLKKNLNSQYAKEYNQILNECKELAKDPNADPNKIAEVERKLAEIESKMGIVHFAAVECKHGSIFAPQ